MKTIFPSGYHRNGFVATHATEPNMFPKALDAPKPLW